jgi:hypothetical protein
MFGSITYKDSTTPNPMVTKSYNGTHQTVEHSHRADVSIMLIHYMDNSAALIDKTGI